MRGRGWRYKTLQKRVGFDNIPLIGIDKEDFPDCMVATFDDKA